MNRDFPRIITLLRKERGISQRKAANDLDISQALLSHYEKGIRECGLDFLVKIAGYYNVSCDYLLGRTPQRNGAVISVDDIPEAPTQSETEQSRANMLAALNRRLITNTTSVIFDVVTKMSSKKLLNAVSAYLMGANYGIFRALYSSNENNPGAMFAVPENVYRGYCAALMEINITKTDVILSGKKGKKQIDLSPESIQRDYPEESAALFNLIQNTEKGLDGFN